MADINVAVFIESPYVKSFLFECSKYWASEGDRVCYISNVEQQDLPPHIQGASTNSDMYLEFVNISFVTAPNAESLMNFLINLQKSPHVPRVLVVEDITGYMSTSDSTEQNFLLLCALLKHISVTCSKFHKSSVFLILSMKFVPEKLNVINFILNPGKIWKTVSGPCDNSNSDVKHFTLQEISTNPLNNTSRTLEFSLIKKTEDQLLRLNNIKDLFEESCNFNNKIF
ncbi:uncharacterized protein LOC135840691 [Planococcus citri]|uniref:uncharacterized protein LOC135840691 n=1 Tax=Planococcus citri TaxID=170843 RepID=UPI0031F9827A